MIKLMTAIIIAGMAFSPVVPVLSKGNRVPVMYTQTETTAETESENSLLPEEDMAGTFKHDSDFLIVNTGGSLAIINPVQKTAAEGYLEASGKGYIIRAAGTDYDGVTASYSDGSWTVDGISYKKWTMAGAYKNKDGTDGYIITVDGTFIFYDDIQNRKGKVYGTYYRDGYQWIFTSPVFEQDSKIGDFDMEKWVIDGNTYEYITLGAHIPVIAMTGIFIKGNIELILGSPVNTLKEKGLSTNEDLSRQLEPGERYELEVYNGRAKARITAINVFTETKKLEDCIVCAFYTEDTSGTFAMNSNKNHCGEENHDDLLTFNYYEYTQDRIVYKKSSMMGIFFNGGARKAISYSGDTDVILNFDGLKLISFEFVLTDLFNTQLIDADADQEIDMQILEEAEKVKKEILEKMEDAFEKADLEIDIDLSTGAVVMDNSILFDFDSSEISDEGKAYLDSFVRTYAGVLLMPEYDTLISEIRFEGHTDSDGNYGYNQGLSQRRAEAVMNYCLESQDNELDEDMRSRLTGLVVAQGYSSSNPVYDDSNNEDKAASRRCEVKFVLNTQAIQDLAGQ